MKNPKLVGILCLIVPPVLVLCAIFLRAVQHVFAPIAETAANGATPATLAAVCSVVSAVLEPLAFLSLLVGFPTGLYLVMRKGGGKTKKEESGSGKVCGVLAAVFAVGFALFVVVTILAVQMTGGV